MERDMCWLCWFGVYSAQPRGPSALGYPQGVVCPRRTHMHRLDIAGMKAPLVSVIILRFGLFERVVLVLREIGSALE
jgi:hypothetical protein